MRLDRIGVASVRACRHGIIVDRIKLSRCQMIRRLVLPVKVAWIRMKMRYIIDTRGKVNTCRAIRVSAWKSRDKKSLKGGEPCGGMGHPRVGWLSRHIYS